MDGSNEGLRVAHCSSAAYTEATTATLDSDGDVGASTLITTGSDGLGLISYNDCTNIALKVLHCENILCLPHFRKESPLQWFIVRK